MKIIDKMKHLIFSVIALGALAFLASAPSYAAVPYASGDVFAGVGGGKVYHYSPTGTLLEQLDTASGSNEETGMCFDSGGNLRTTNFTAGNMTLFDNAGNLITHPWGGPF